MSALEDLFEAELELGRHAEAVGELGSLVADHPLRERLRAQLMLALYRAGRQAEALAVYQDGRTVLVEELGIDPGLELRDLEGAILRQDVSLAAPPPVKDTGGRQPTPPLPAPLQVSWDRGFVGRAAQLEALAQAWASAAAGERQVVVVTGEPGIGKTRLVREAALAMHDQGATVLFGRCDADLGVPYQPFMEAIAHYVTTSGDDGLATGTWEGCVELARIVPELARRVQDLPRSSGADPETDRYRLFQAVVALVARASEARPVVLVLEDLHWATKPTVLLFRHLATSVVPGAFLLIATYRHTDVSPTDSLNEALADLGREHGVRRLFLEGMDQGEVVSLIELSSDRIAGDRAGDTLALGLWRDTNGNPFFVTEILRHLAESAVQAPGNGRPAPWADIDASVVPDTVRDVIRRRLRRLSEGVNRALTVAAVIGQDFDLSVASRANKLADEELLDLLEEAGHAAFVTEVPDSPGRFCFAHALIRHTLYDGLGLARRAQIHRQVAEALESQKAQSGVTAQALAHHWLSAGTSGDSAKAVHYARQAGERALAELAYEEATVHFERALSSLDPDSDDPADQRLRCDLLLALASAQGRSADQRYRATVHAAAAVARELGDGERLARAAFASARANASFKAVGQSDGQLVALYDEALRALGPGDSVLRARLQSLMAVELVWTRERETRHRLCREATEMARRLGDPAGLAHVLAASVTAIWDPTTLDDRVAMLDELSQVASDLDNTELTVRACLLRAACDYESADVAGAQEKLANAAQLARDLRQPFWTWLIKTVQAAQLMLEGSPEAEPAMFAAYELGERCGQPDAAMALAVALYDTWWAQGRLSEALGFLEAHVESMPAVPTYRAGLAHTYCELGRMDEAREQFEVLAETGFDLPRDAAWSTGMTLLAETCATLGDADRARTIYELVLPFPDRLAVAIVGQWCGGSMARSLGLLATTMGAWDDAEGHFRHAIDVNARIGARPFLVRTKRGLRGDARRPGRAGGRSPGAGHRRGGDGRRRRPEHATRAGAAAPARRRCFSRLCHEVRKPRIGGRETAQPWGHPAVAQGERAQGADPPAAPGADRRRPARTHLSRARLRRALRRTRRPAGAARRRAALP